MNCKVDRKSTIPIYVQIVEQLRVIIKQFVEENREKFYTEDELAKMFNVSRLTIRQAVQILVDENVLNRIKGSGTFISTSEKLEANIENLDKFVNGFYLDQELRTELLFNRIVPSPTWVSNRLGIKPYEDVVYIKRLRLVGDIPIVVDNRYLLLELGKKITDEDLLNTSLVHILTPKLNLNIIESAIEIEARLADEDLSNLLSIPEGSPVLYRYADMKAENYGCFLTGNSFFRADMYKYKSVLRDM
ncbi:GntR family transcriptional regulator [Bacillus sp. JZ8]